MIALLLLSAAGVGDVPEADRVEVRALVDRARVAREGIRSYHLVVRESYRMADADAGGRDLERITAVWAVWKEGDRTRTDVLKVESTPKAVDEGVRKVVCQNGVRAGYAAHTHIDTRGRFVTPVQFKPIGAAYNQNDQYNIGWKSIGYLNLSTNEYPSYPPHRDLLWIRDQPNTTLALVGTGDQAVRQLRADFRNKGTLTYTFRPSYGLNPVEIEQQTTSDRYRMRTTAEYAKAAGTDIWFPTRVQHTRAAAGVIALDQTLVFETVEINRPIPPEVFTLAGFGLPQGVSIAYPEIKKSEDEPTWDGQKVDPNRTLGQRAAEAYRAMQQATPPVPDTPEPGRRWPYYLGGGLLALVGGGLLALVGGGLLYRARRRRAAA